MTDSLCIFDGLMETENSHSYRGTLTWHGVWLVHKSPDAKAVEEPKRAPTAQMVDSDMTFRVTGTATPVAVDTKDSTWAQPCEIHWQDGSFDTSSSRVTIQDTAHSLLVTKLRWTGGEQIKNLVFGLGVNQFGKFIEVGWMRPGNRVTVARRYVAVDDTVRSTWNLAKLKQMVLADIYDEEDDEIVMPPWHTNIFNSKYHG